MCAVMASVNGFYLQSTMAICAWEHGGYVL